MSFVKDPRAADPRVILRRHPEFMVVSSVLLALLYVEEAWALGSLFPRRSASELSGWMLAAGLVVLAGTLLAFFVPLSLANPRRYPRAWGVLSTSTFQSSLISIATNVVILVLFLALVQFDLSAVPTILKDVYLFTLITLVLFHALLLYVRYMHYLYAEFGGSDNPAKVLLTSGGLGALILIVGLYLFQFDIQAVSAAPEATRVIMGLHVYVRDLYLWSLALGAYAWHLRWLADH